MGVPIERLTAAPGVTDPEPFAGPDHPMRKLTRAVAFDGEWTPDRAAKVSALFDGMAAEWAARLHSSKLAPVIDALDRGGVARGGRWLELGSGTGAGTSVLAEQFEAVIALDLSRQMLLHAPGHLAPRVQGDASSLPFAAGTFRGVLILNMLLFPAEVTRVLAPDGVVVWVNSLGDQTPIHLPVEEVLEVFGPGWTARTADAGTGFWATLRRDVLR
jgi:SAM-dependent methyltransferase